MERVNGMPIMVKFTKAINDERLSRSFEENQIIEMTEYDYNWFLKEFPDYIEEIEMTEKDWIQLATERISKCKEEIEKLKRDGIKVNSYYISIIPREGEVVDGHGFGGGLPDVYRKISFLEKDIMKYKKQAASVEKVDGMPNRIVITKRIESDELITRVIEPGTVMDLNSYDLELFKNDFNESFTEIVMTREDWIQLATTSARNSQKRIAELEQLYGEKFESYYTSVIPAENKVVDGQGFSGGLKDAYTKTKILARDVEAFEQRCINNSRSR